MHFEILVEGQSERTALEPLMVKILGLYGQPHTWRIHKHRGIGKIPTNPLDRPNSKDPTLLHNLPAKLRAYGKSLTRDEAVIVLVELLHDPNNAINMLLERKIGYPEDDGRVIMEDLRIRHEAEVDKLKLV